MVKFLRGLLVFILSLFLIGFINGFMISVTIEQVIQKDLISSVFKQTALPSITNSIGLGEEEQKAFEELMNDEQVNETINEISSELIGALGDPEASFDQNSLDAILDYFIDNKDKLEELTGSEVDISQIEDFKNSEEYKDLGNQLTESIKESTSNMDEASKNAIRLYSFIISKDFRIICIIGAVIILGLIALVQWSYYKWLSTFGKSLTTCGVGITLFALCSNELLSYFTREYDFKIDLNLGGIFFMGAMSIIIGILLVIVCKNIKNMITVKSNEEVESSAIS